MDVLHLLASARSLGSADVETVLVETLRSAKALLDETSVAELLLTIGADASTVHALLGLGCELAHVGLLVSSRLPLARLAELAAEAGFDRGHVTFPSAVVARELGALSGRESVPTTVLKASAAGPRGRDVGVELFLPHEASDVVDAWIQAGVGAHVALSLVTPSLLREASSLLSTSGFRVPSFMGGGPVWHPIERLTTIYLDGRAAGRTVRVELACAHEDVCATNGGA